MLGRLAIGASAVGIAMAALAVPASASALRPATTAQLTTAHPAAAGTPPTTARATPAMPATSSTGGYVAPSRTLQYGDRGSDVTAMQHRLAALHYWLNVTGVFDYDTQEAVYAFQAINKLSMDGVVGPMTRNALVRPHAYTPQDPSVATRVEVNIYPKVQVLVYYKDHNLALISHISSAGGYRFCDSNGCSIATTPTGWYRANWFAPGWVTVPLGAMYNPVFFIGGSYAIHGDTSVPNYPASHGCVRIPDDLAKVFHTMISVSYSSGTRIHVYSRSGT
ncbi:MAG TPA: peptidoglycan-binding protein [Trebonia sp.]|nr:peptidoglycan-binding protein [Trebonia sp.]